MKNIIKKTFFFIVIYLLNSGDLSGQSDRPIEERIESQRIAFITQRVNLTPQEAQAFWPIYNEYREKEKQLKSSKSDRDDILDMDEADAEAYLNKLLDIEQRELDLKKQYTIKLKTVLSSKKILRFYGAERMFKEKLLQAMNERRNSPRK